MDKKNLTIGAVLLVAAFAVMYLAPHSAPPAAPTNVPPATASQAAPNSAAPAVSGPEAASTSGAAEQAPQATAPTTTFAALAHDAATAKLTTLENDVVAVHFTNFGGAIQDVALKKYPAELNRPEPFVFNALHADPMLAFTDFAGLDRSTPFQLVSHSATEVVYRTTIYEGRVEVTRRYTLVAQPDKSHDPYQLRQVTTFKNLTDQTVPLPRVALNLGTAAPVDARDVGLQLTAGYSSGKDQGFYARSKLEPGNGLLGIGAHAAVPSIASPGPIVWGSVSNQFFAAIFTPDKPGTGLVTRRVKLFPALSDADRNAFGLTSSAQFEIAPLAAHGESTLSGDFYVGPKEYRRLSNPDVFKANQDKVMQFGFFKFFSQLLLTLMTWIHGWFGSAKWAWGWAIVLTTAMLKLVFIPFTLAASRSAKRMQKIQPEIQAIREKYKDNPQKMQAATMELFKKHRVNPVGGCLPMLITLPFFWGFFEMLRSAAELRFQPFLWAPDLTAPDTVGHLFGLPVNILPILLGGIMIVQMRLTPTPSVDNAQAKLMRLMPYGFALFYYLWPCSLALYSMVNGIFTIGQQLVINRMRDDPGPAGPGTAAAEVASAFSRTRPVKNVTPKKK